MRRKVERLVGSQYSSAVPGLVPNIVPAPSVTFVSQLWRVHCACGRHIYSGANVSVHPRRTLCAVGVQRLVRISISAARLFRSQFHNVFSSAESGRISGQADLHIFRSERQRSPSAHLVRRSGGTPCWDFHFGCSCPGPVRNRGRVVDALCERVVEGPFHVR